MACFEHPRTRFNGVSAILPVNMESPTAEQLEALNRAAESVLGQDAPLPLELLMVDDGSNPPLSELPATRSLRERQDVRLIHLSRNHGLVFALNVGLRRSRYDLIARIDADDRWRPGKLRRQVEAFDRDPDLTLVATSMRTRHTLETLDRDHVRGTSWEEILEFAVTAGCPFPHGSILARKDVFDVLGGYPHAPAYRHCEDYALWAHWLRFFKCAILPEILFEYSISESQISARHADQQIAASRLVQRTLAELAHKDIPKAVAEIASALHTSLLKTGKVLCAAWLYYNHILVDRPMLDAVRTVLPDRLVYCWDEVAEVMADRCLSLHEGDRDYARSAAHIPVLHRIADLAAIVE